MQSNTGKGLHEVKDLSQFGEISLAEDEPAVPAQVEANLPSQGLTPIQVKTKEQDTLIKSQ